MLGSETPSGAPHDTAHHALTREAEQLIDESHRLLSLDLTLALSASETAVLIARQIGPKLLAQALNRRASVHLRLLDFGRAEADLQHARDLCTSPELEALLATIEMQSGTLCWYRGETTCAYAHYRTALDLAARHGDRHTIAGSHNNLGLVHTRTGDYSAALEEQLAALEHFRALGETGSQAVTQLNIAVSFYWLGRYREAAEILQQIVTQVEGTPQADLLTRARLNLGATYVCLGEHREAESVLLEAMKLSTAHALHLDGYILRELGQAYLHDTTRTPKAEALDAFERSLAFCREHQDLEGEVQALNHLGETHARLGNPDLALSHHQQALRLAVACRFHNDATVAHRHLALLHETRGEYREAYGHLREQARLEQERLQEQAEQRGQLLMVRYRTDQALQQARLAQKETELERLRNEELALALRALEHADRERQELVSRLEHQAQHDQLTGLANRTLYHQRVQQAVERAREANLNAAVLYLDLDGFKQINDSLGHDAGDELLRVIAARLLACVTPTDTVARLGGDEFTFVLADVRRTDRVAQVARDVLRVVRLPVTLDGRSVYVTGSVGVAVFPADGEDAATLQRHADGAMYAAKRTGKNAWLRHGKGRPDAGT